MRPKLLRALELCISMKQVVYEISIILFYYWKEEDSNFRWLCCTNQSRCLWVICIDLWIKVALQEKMLSDFLYKRSFVACAVWHIAPSCWNHLSRNIHIFKFRTHKNYFHPPVPFAAKHYCGARFVLKEVWAIDSAEPILTPNPNFFWMHL